MVVIALAAAPGAAATVRWGTPALRAEGFPPPAAAAGGAVVAAPCGRIR